MNKKMNKKKQEVTGSGRPPRLFMLAAAAAASAGKAEPTLHPLLSLSAILTVVGPKPSTPAVVLGAMSIYLSILSASEPKQKKRRYCGR